MDGVDINQTNVIAVNFKEDDEAYAALARLKELDSDKQIDLRSAAVVTRDASGRVIHKEQAGSEEWVGTATGGIIGLLIGILGGPLGVLIGGATGLLIGSLFDLDDTEDIKSVLAAISETVRAGHNTLLAELSEPSDHKVVDAVMATRSGTVLRRKVQDVEAEIAAAEEAQREAKKQARKRLMEERQAKQKAAVEAKIAELKAKLPRHHDGPAGHERDSAEQAASSS
jgi:uncharacterized membrane protein